MPSAPASPDPLGLSRADWRRIVSEWSLPAYRGDQIFEGLHRHGARDFGRIRQLPGSLRERLAAEMPIRLPEIVRREASADGTVKYGLRLSDGALIEAVLMPGSLDPETFEDARTRPKEKVAPAGPRQSRVARRNSQITNHQSSIAFTVCLSSQTGCAVDCAFCVTGRLGGGRNLSAGEIVGQLEAVLDDAERSWEGLRVVFMGMGEPLLNLDGVTASLAVLFELLPARRVTVSTSGITPALGALAALPVRPNLAVSINAAEDETRTRLMPINRSYPLAGLIDALRAWPADARHPITAEYVLIAGRNDSEEDASRLARLLQGLPVKVNLIPLNEDPVYLPGWKRPDEQAIDRFARRLRDRGARVTVRRSKGPDASAACGQLKGRTADVRKRRAPLYS
jgi:23S rRNA (adenine2503-C2)-methyltransferase